MPQIAIVGEAWGAEEEKQRAPFVGASGYELTKMLTEAGIHRAGCFLTNVFNLRPANNKIEGVCGPKAEGIKGMPYLIKGKYVRQEFIPELERLGAELEEQNPNLIVALGNTPLWALTGQTGISKLRGSTCLSTRVATGFKVLPTYHPAAILRQWDLRPVAVIDLIKAKREAEFPEVRRPQRKIYIPETVEEIDEYFKAQGRSICAVDIETSGRRITCIGFAPSPSEGIVIPIVNKRRKGGNHWPDDGTESQVWKIIRRVLEDGTVPKVFQNGLYDISFLWRSYGIRVYGAEHDTMLLHHALYPESLKSLGFLGSVYTDEGAWKLMRKNVETIKRED